jgi:putative transcriptional regulator
MPEIDVRGLRQSLEMTQQAFADRFGFSLSSVREWEQKRSRPDKAARVLLMIVKHAPHVVEEATKGLASAKTAT